MTAQVTSFVPGHTAVALRRAAVRATMAPSVHNTQPWRLHLAHGELRIFADRSRQLAVLDPTSRQLTISVGCAVMNARVAMAGIGMGVEVTRFPDRAQPELMACLRPTPGPPDAELMVLDRVLERRQTNRRRFAEEEVPADVLDCFEAAAANEGSMLHIVRDPDQRMSVAALSQQADAIETLNPAYRAELRAWTAVDGARGDGVPDLAVPHVGVESHDEVPIRDFDSHGTGALPAGTHSSRNQCLALICTAGDTTRDWLRAGEGLERVLLEITRSGFVASPLTQVTEVPSARAQLRRELQLMTYPHVLLRIGRAPITSTSRRRRLVEVLIDES